MSSLEARVPKVMRVQLIRPGVGAILSQPDHPAPALELTAQFAGLRVRRS
jgi:hypothetical protein